MVTYLSSLIENPDIQTMLIDTAEMFMQLFVELTLLFPHH